MANGLQGAFQNILGPVGQVRSGIKLGLDPIYAQQLEERKQSIEQSKLLQQQQTQRQDKSFQSNEKSKQINTLLGIMRGKETFSRDMREKAASEFVGLLPDNLRSQMSGGILAGDKKEQPLSEKQIIDNLDKVMQMRSDTEMDPGVMGGKEQTVLGDYQSRMLNELNKRGGKKIIQHDIPGQKVPFGKDVEPRSIFQNMPINEDPMPTGGGAFGGALPENVPMVQMGGRQGGAMGMIPSAQPMPQVQPMQIPTASPGMEQPQEQAMAAPEKETTQPSASGLDMFIEMAAERLGPNATDAQILMLAEQLSGKK